MKLSAFNPSDQGWISKIYKALVEFYKKNISKFIKKWVEEMIKNALNEEIQMVCSHLKKMLRIINCLGNSNINNNEISPHTTETNKHQNLLQLKVICMLGKRISMHYWWKCQLVQSVLKNNNGIPPKIKNTASMWVHNSMPWKYTLRIKTTILKRHFLLLCSFITRHNSPNIEKPKNRWVDKQPIVSIHNAFLLNIKKRCSHEIFG